MVNACSPISLLPAELTQQILYQAISSDLSKSVVCFRSCLLTCKAWFHLCREGSLSITSKQSSHDTSSIFARLSRTLTQALHAQLNQIPRRQVFMLLDPQLREAKRKAAIDQLLCFERAEERKWIQELDVSAMDCSVPELMRMVEELPYLRTLKINVHSLWASHQFNQETFHELLGKCQHLNALTVHYSTLPSTAFIALKQCPQLEFIDLSYSKKLDGTIFLYLADLPSLQNINLAYCTEVSSQFISSLSHQTLPWQKLNISNCQNDFSLDNLMKLLHLPADFELINEEEIW